MVAPGVLVAAILMACGDIAGMAGQAHRFLGGALDVLATGTLMVGVYAWTGLWVTVVFGLFLALVSRGRPDDLFSCARTGIARLFLGRDVGVGARILSALICVAGFFGAMFLAVSKISERVNTPNLAGLSAAGIALGAVVAFVVAWFVLYMILEAAGRLPVVRTLLAARTVTIAILLVALAGLVAAIVLERRIFKSLDGWRIYLPAISAVAFIAVTVFQPFRLISLPKRPTGIARAAGGVVLLAVIALGLFWAGGYGGPRALMLSFGKNGAQAAGLWSRVFDFDHDGASTILGGGDCEPWNKAVHPGAADIPDNSVDEDCQDGDLKAAHIAVKPATLTNPWKEVRKPDVIVISIDGCRRDAIGAYGAKAGRTPNIDRLAAESVVFDDAIAPASWTTPAFASILSGRYAGEIPGYYGLSRMKPVPASMPLLFKPFKSSGYRTVAVTAGLQLDKLGLSRDLDDWISVSKGPRARLAGKTADRAIAEIEKAKKDKPLFMWVHFIDPHYPYDPPAEHQLFGKDARGRYAGEVHYADAGLGRVLEALEKSGRSDRAIVVMFADHGEAFLEHGREFHGESVYAEEVRVPLMIRIPSVPPARLSNLVSSLDIGPTLWDLIGAKKSQPTRGLSLAPLIVEGKVPDRTYVFSEQTRKVKEFGLTSADYRLRYDRTLNRHELFDRKADPAEQEDISARNPVVLREMRMELTRNLAAIDLVANRKTGDVLLKSVPGDYVKTDAQFRGGPRLAAYKVVRKGRKVNFAAVFKARGPFGESDPVKVVLNVRDGNGASIWTAAQDVAGTYAPSTWRGGDLVRHRAEFSLKAEPPAGAKICLALLEGDTQLEIGTGVYEKCFALP